MFDSGPELAVVGRGGWGVSVLGGVPMEGLEAFMETGDIEGVEGGWGRRRLSTIGRLGDPKTGDTVMSGGEVDHAAPC